MQHPDEGMIHTWLEGELSPEEATALEAHVAECDQCKAAVAEARGFIAASSRIVSALDAVPGGVIPIAKPAKKFWYSSPQFRAAAAVLVVVGASLLVMRTGTRNATVAVADSAEVNEAASAKRAMPMIVSAPLSAPSAQPKAPQVAQAAPAHDMAAAKTSTPKVMAASEEDFSGKGVRGGTAAGVSGAVAAPPMRAADAVRSGLAFGVVKSELKVVRVDSSAIMKKTTYQSLSGSEVVLTEQEPAPAPFPAPLLSKAAPTADESRQRVVVTGVATAPSPVVSNSPAAPAPMAQRDNAVHTISWVDPVTRRRYSLTGPVSVEELEAIKSRLLQTKR